MKYLLLPLILLFSLPEPGAAPRRETGSRPAEVTSEGLPVFALPSGDSERLGEFSAGTPVSVLAETVTPEGLWCAVEMPAGPEFTGFVSCRALRFLSAEETSSPETAADPLPSPPAAELSPPPPSAVPDEFKASPAFLPGAFLQALWEGDSAKVEQMLNQGLDPNRPTSLGARPLIIAAKIRNPDMLRLLIAKGADLEGRDAAESTALLAAASAGLEKNVELLVAAGADVNSRDNRGMTPLFWASIQGFPEIAAFLLSAGTDWRVKSKDGWTALQSSRTILANAQKNLSAAGSETPAEVLQRLQSRVARYEKVVSLLEKAGERE
jgi:hypothetical protein